MIPLHTDMAEHDDEKKCGSYEVVKSRSEIQKCPNGATPLVSFYRINTRKYPCETA